MASSTLDPDDSSLAFESEEQLWHELHDVVTTQCPAHAHETIDNALRAWLSLASRARHDFPASFESDPGDDVVAYCSQRLLQSGLFDTNPDYVRTQIIFSLLQEDEPGPLYVIVSLLLHDGRTSEATFRRMIDEGCFSRLLDLISGRDKSQDPALHRLLLDLMYEMSRIERLRYDDLLHVDDGFITYLFSLIEDLSDDVHDPYHYPIIRVLLMLNEQYMITSTAPANGPDSPTAPLTNRVIKCLSLYGPIYRTFGENLILVLNRETETSLQLLILKLLYLLFTTRATYEYFYTNDLCVLVDVIIRNLLDLPNELMSLRHTYLRVLYPLLAHTQLNQPSHYKRDEIRKVLTLLAGSDNAHFAPADETTLRLVDRVAKVPWIAGAESGSEDSSAPTSPASTRIAPSVVLPEEEASGEENGGEGSGTAGVGSGTSKLARKMLGISLSHKQSTSNISVVDVAAVQEKPGIQTPSRNAMNATNAKEVDGGAQTGGVGHEQDRGFEDHHQHHRHHRQHHHHSRHRRNGSSTHGHNHNHSHSRSYSRSSRTDGDTEEGFGKREDGYGSARDASHSHRRGSTDFNNYHHHNHRTKSIEAKLPPPAPRSRSLSKALNSSPKASSPLKHNSSSSISSSNSSPTSNHHNSAARSGSMHSVNGAKLGTRTNGEDTAKRDSAASTPASATPTATGRRPRKPLPEVPKHRHGTPFVKTTTAAATTATTTTTAAGTNTMSAESNSLAAAAKKKQPPKAPPPRRKGRLKTGSGAAAAPAGDGDGTPDSAGGSGSATPNTSGLAP